MENQFYCRKVQIRHSDNPFDKSDIPFMVFVWVTVCDFYKIHLHYYSDLRWLDFRMKYQ